MIFEVLDKLENLEEKEGMLGTIFGLLILVVATVTTFIGITLLVKFNISVLNWFIESFWFK